MEFHVNLADRGDRATRIYRELMAAILDGRLRTGERLPPTRELAKRLDVARNTVASAYERLVAEGFLESRVGAGTFVLATAPTRTPGRAAPTGGDVRPRRLWRSMPPPLRDTSTPPVYDFRVGTPDVGLFPLETWRRLVVGELRGSRLEATYGDPAGHAGLRAAIARYVGNSRSVRTAADDLIITRGAQQAIDLIGRVLVEPGSCVAVEEPGYPPVRLLFQSLGARVVGVPVDAEGLVVDAIPAAARLVYVTPSHQFPLGTPMSLARRTALLAHATRHRAVVVEDDYDSEFRFSDRPLEPLQSLDRSGRVIYVGSFSKTMLPTLRLGFLVAPASLRETLLAARQLTDWHGDPTVEGAMARFIDDGLLARHIRKASRDYAARHDRIVATLRRDFDDWLEPVPSVAGLHLCARLVDDTVEGGSAGIVARARALGVAVETLERYCASAPAQAGLVLGYGTIPTAHIPAGLRRLTAAFQ